MLFWIRGLRGGFGRPPFFLPLYLRLAACPIMGYFAHMEIKNIYNQIADTYDSRYKKPLHFVEEEIIAEHLPNLYPHSKVLDVGCGTANMITVGQFTSEQYFGIDISENMVDIARQKYPDYSFENLDGRESVGDGEWDLALYVFGQLNYMHLEPWIQSLCANVNMFNGEFLAVVYAQGYQPNYVNKEIGYPPAGIICMMLEEHGFDFTLNGLSFPMIGDEQMSYQQLYNRQIAMTKSGELEGCKYWIINGGYPKSKPDLRVVK